MEVALPSATDAHAIPFQRTAVYAVEPIDFRILFYFDVYVIIYISN